LTCVYYPVSVLPHWLQAIAWALPPTYVFEGMRALVMERTFRADLMIEAFALNALYFTAAVIAFLALLESSRRAGSLLQPGEYETVPSAVSMAALLRRKSYTRRQIVLLGTING